MLEHGTIRSLFLIKLEQIRPAMSLKFTTQTFSCEIREILKNTYFEEHLPTNASVNKRQQETHALSGKKTESHLEL